MLNPIKAQAQIESITDFGGGVYQVDMALSNAKANFKPGQFLHLALDDFDPANGFWPQSRVFSIASQAGGNSLSIVYSVKGEFTKRMESELRLGCRVWLKFPYGDFIIDRQLAAGQAAVLIAGGTGVSPFIPYLLSAGFVAGGARVDLFYGVKTIRQALFLDKLVELRTANPQYALHLYVEAGDKHVPEARSGTIDFSEALRIGQAGGAVYFLSGPPAMINYGKRFLMENHISEARIIIDNWGEQIE